MAKVEVYQGQNNRIIDTYTEKTTTAKGNLKIKFTTSALDKEGSINVRGNGQLNFKVTPEDGYMVSAIEVEKASYKNIKSPAETAEDGISDIFRITRIRGDVKVSITTVPIAKVSFVKDDGVSSIELYDTQDYTAQPTTVDVNKAYSAKNTAGTVDVFGDGQVNFKVNLADGATLKSISVSPSDNFANLKATETPGVYRVTKVTGDIRINVNTADNLYATFTTDEGVNSIQTYATQDYTTTPQTISNHQKVYALDPETGVSDLLGNGQINFKVNLADGYMVKRITVSPIDGYTNLKDPEEIGEENIYRITRLADNVTVTVETVKNDQTVFVKDAGVASVDVYYKQDYTSPDASDVTTAQARNSDTGLVDLSGDGQINFKVNLKSGYTLKKVEVVAKSAGSEYKNLKEQGNNIYRVTKIYGGLTVTITTEEIAATDVTLDQQELTFHGLEDARALVATVGPDNALNKAVSWTTDDPSVATVTDSGRVTPVGVGTTRITAKAGNVSAGCVVTVESVAATLVRMQGTLTLTEGDAPVNLTAEVVPQNTTDRDILWTTSDPTVATVSGGKVTPVGVGTATITAAAGDKSATCTVTVEEKQSGDNRQPSDQDSGSQTSGDNEQPADQNTGNNQQSADGTGGSGNAQQTGTTDTTTGQQAAAQGKEASQSDAAEAAEEQKDNGITLSKTTIVLAYSAKAQTVKLASTAKPEADYGTLKYKSSDKRVTVSGKGVVSIPKGFSGNFKITVSVDETTEYAAAGEDILIKIPTGTEIGSVKNSAKKTATITWKKNTGVTGYQIQYAQKKNMKGAKTVTVTKTKTTSLKLAKLSKKTYYIRMRTYIKSGSKRYCGKWSAVKKVKIKK